MGPWDFLFDSQVARVTWLEGGRAISNAHRSYLFARDFRSNLKPIYIHVYRYSRIALARIPDDASQRAAYPAGPVRPCIPVHVHASHIGGRSSSRMQKKSSVGESWRPHQVQPTLVVVEVARASVRQSHV